MSDSSYLLVIGEREALAWILRQERMAFPAGRARSLGRVKVGDELFMLTTRGCYHNPTRDRTLIMGSARVASEIHWLDQPVAIAGREFALGCSLILETLAPLRHGVELAPLVNELEAFPKKHAWAAVLRRPLVNVSGRDAQLLRCLLRSASGAVDIHRPEYLSSIRPVQVQHPRRSSAPAST